MIHAMSCYDFAMFRKTGGQRGGTGHDRARSQLDILSTLILPVLSVVEGSVAEAESKEACRRE